MKSRLLFVVSAGAALTVGACATPDAARTQPEPERTSNPPPPSEEAEEAQVEEEAPEEVIAEVEGADEDGTDLPDPPEGPEENDTPVKPTDTLPTWSEVESGHPKGATNPPIPVLIVTPDGDCYKDWMSPMAPPMAGQPRGDRVQEDCSEGCGTAVQCPDKAAPLLAEWEKSTE